MARINSRIPIEKISFIGKEKGERLKKLNIFTPQDLLFHFPFRYEDFRNFKKISQLQFGEKFTICGKILTIENFKSPKKKLIISQAIIEDETGGIKAIWYNQPFLKNVLKKGKVFYFSGKLKFSPLGTFLENPIYEEKKTNPIHTKRLVPIYPETEKISSRFLRYIISRFLFKFGNKIEEILPQEIIRKYNLLKRNEALFKIHFPESLKEAQKAKERFSFEELFLIQLAVLREKLKLKKFKAPKIKMNLKLIRKFISFLPFKLTNAQRKSAYQILKDLEKNKPMNRLLQGDVGSGKTIVSLIASLNTTEEGWQVALMTPTEILAHQHFETFSDYLFPFKVKIGLLTSKEDKINSIKIKGEKIEISKRKLLEKLEKGEIQILIGTHTLIQEKTKFKNLGLIIVDEQHRFGVAQRAKLAHQNLKSSFVPHFLSMTATPIPRTLALTLYGDLDISILDELPPKRKKIITKIISPKERKWAYHFLKKEIKKKRQAFVICPKIEQTPNGKWAEVKAVKEEWRKLSQQIFPDLKVALLHGKMKTKEKEKVLKDFKEGKIDILVSTSVVEVGIDIPQATVMMIEGAERFGLAQLHQFRGRIRRSIYQPYCFLLTDSSSKKAKERLSALLLSDDGLKLAEKDLKIRGPGTLYGLKQWGIPDLAMEKLKDIKLVERTREAAREILEKDPNLTFFPFLKKALKKLEKRIHFE